ncbi:MAG: HNH endonuclease signature motif containing protein [Negativicoccus succinicivorans]|uniref:HNH endonuclease n=1 Tax=Negativicoccus succinicivorans TaxID=620903 RepID=UPI0029120A75|nr:HNH endonuclease signature motif containing protein [Negativicoccus succinicivorans]MDU5943716.1 HNH endonuclease signature motif containing protein [Negativicoccus succinicivorans]
MKSLYCCYFFLYPLIIYREKIEAYEKHGHKCAGCGKKIEYSEMEDDHIKPWSKGGRTVPENCQMLCTKCNLKKSNH